MLTWESKKGHKEIDGKPNPPFTYPENLKPIETYFFKRMGYLTTFDKKETEY